MRLGSSIKTSSSRLPSTTPSKQGSTTSAGPSQPPLGRSTPLGSEARVRDQASTASDRVNIHQRRVMEKVRKTFGDVGEWLQPGVGYPGHRVHFEDGNPAAFWVNFNTKAREEFRVRIEDNLPCSSGPSLEVGSLEVGGLVLARYRGDSRVYRAKLEEVVRNCSLPWVATVRYLDYGNYEDRVLPCDLYPWDPLLDVVPPQAVLCCLYGAPETQQSTTFPKEVLKTFDTLMEKSGPFKLTVVKRLQPPGHVFQPGTDFRKPELEVSLVTREGTNMLEKLRQDSVLRDYFQYSLSCQPPDVHVVSPLHLQCQTGSSPPYQASQAVSNVGWWLENKFEEKKESIVDENLSEAENQRWSDPSQTPTEAVSDNSNTKECHPILEVKSLQLPMKPIFLPQQQPELNPKGEFLWMLGHLANPGEVWVQPLGPRLQQVEAALAVEPPCLRRDELVVEESCWAVQTLGLLPPSLCSCTWLRVRVESVQDQQVAVRSLDYGTPLVVTTESLHILSPGVTFVPGLAVRCHLSKLVATDQSWGEEVSTALAQMLDWSSVYSALVDEKVQDCLGIFIILEPGGEEDHTTVNHRLVEAGLARWEREEEDSGVVVGGGWDPMTQDFTTIANNYLTNDNDVQSAVQGYKSKARICQFFQNNDGHCWKGSYCQELHQLPKEGAVTTDQEELEVEARQQLLLRPHTSPKQVLLAHVYSPSCFYLTFPNGTRDLTLLSHLDLQRSTNPRHAIFQTNLDSFYDSSPKRFLLSSLPAPGSLLVVRLDRAWHRATVVSTPQAGVEEDVVQTVLLVDEGREERVRLNDIRKLDPSFSTFPHQAVLSCLAEVEPLSDTWSPDATTFFTKFARSGLLSATVLSHGSGEALVTQVKLCYSSDLW